MDEIVFLLCLRHDASFFISDMKCDKCKTGYFNLSASNPLGCSPCECSPLGSLNQFCHDNGDCSCRSNIIGRQCDECVDGYYNFPQRCLPCVCNPKGTIPGSFCDKKSGQCQCKTHVSGLSCDICEDGAYGFDTSPVTGCVKCSCLAEGTVNSSSNCQKESGECLCKANVVGANCNQCKPGFWGLSGELDEGCQPCMCDETGTEAGAVCEQNTGNCTCLMNRIGRRCDDCVRSRYM